MAGAGKVIAADIDPFSRAASALNAAANAVEFAFTGEDFIGTDAGWDIVLAGDVFYDRELAGRLTPWFAALRRRGAEVLVGDPGRSYLPRDRLEALAVYQVPVSRALEDAEVKKTTVWRFL
jgi:predicted nicotinamide N-methyase